MKIHTLVLGQMMNCCYIVENNGAAILIDPSWQMDTIEDFLTRHNLKPAAAIFTHGHYDHLYNAAELLQKYNIKGYIEQGDVKMSELPAGLLQIFAGDFKADIAGLPVEFLHTPGHSKGSVCVMIEGNLFTGDTLFPGACGRTDLPGSDPKQIQKSLERLAHLPPQTKVYSGHTYGPRGGGETTIAHEIKTNPYIKLAVSDIKAFEDMCQ